MSIRITKATAEEVTNILLSNLKQKRDSAQNELKSFVSKKYLETIPKEIVDIYNNVELRRFLDKTSMIYIFYMGSHFSISVDESLPYRNGERLNLNREDAEILEKLRNEYNKLKSQYSELYFETVNTLMRLATYNKINQEFPEAGKLLPEQNNKLMININATRQKVKEVLNEN